MSKVDGELTTESFLKMVPWKTKIFFIFIFVLVFAIVILSLSLNDYLFFAVDRLTNVLEDFRDYLASCRHADNDDDFGQSTGRRKGSKRYRRKYRRKRHKRDHVDHEEESEEEEEDEDSDDEVVMAYWRMVEGENRGFDDTDLNTSPLTNQPALATGTVKILKIQIGTRYQHETGIVNCHVMKIGGLMGKMLKENPWSSAGGVFTRLLLLTKDGLILKKDDSKTKKICSAMAGEVCFDEYFSFQIPLCQINNVILIVSLFVVSGMKKEVGEDAVDGKAKESQVDGSSERIETKKPVSWISFGLNPSSNKTLDQWSLMVQHSDEVKNWHELTRPPLF